MARTITGGKKPSTVGARDVPASAAGAAQTPTSTTSKPGPATPGQPTIPTTTIPPWDATPTNATTAGTPPTPPQGPGAASKAGPTTAGFDPAASVPIDAETTPTKLVYANPDGTKTAKISLAPVRFRDGAGMWTDFDLTLVPRPDGSLGAKAAPDAATQSRSAVGGVATVQTSAGPVVLRHPGGTPAAAVLGANTATYGKAVGGRDLKLGLTRDGFEESVVLPDANSPGSYIDELVLPPGTKRRHCGRGAPRPKRGCHRTFGGGFAYDASFPRGDIPVPVSVRVLSQVANVVTVTVAIVDPEWLAAPGRLFPVTIDPV